MDLCSKECPFSYVGGPPDSIVDDDESVREALCGLLRSVWVRSELVRFSREVPGFEPN